MGAYGGFCQKPQLALSNVSWAHRLYVPMTLCLRKQINDRANAAKKEVVKKSISKSSGKKQVILGWFRLCLFWFLICDKYIYICFSNLVFKLNGYAPRKTTICQYQHFFKSKERRKRPQAVPMLPVGFWGNNCKTSHRMAYRYLIQNSLLEMAQVIWTYSNLKQTMFWWYSPLCGTL